MTYTEYEKAVYEECKKYKITEAHPDDFEKTFNEEKESGYIKKAYEKERSIVLVAWEIWMLI